MGTRADFYIGRGEAAEWLGSIAWDGYPEGVPEDVLKASSESNFRQAVSSFLQSRDDATLPEDGWPWPWDDSRTTDFTYAHDGQVWVACFGRGWFESGHELEDADPRWTQPEVPFPDMKKRKNVAFGARSGIIVVQG